MVILRQTRIKIEADDAAGLRTKLRAEVIAGGYPPARADEVIDLAFHAADTAMAAMSEVIGRASKPEMIVTIMGIAIALAQGRLQSANDEIIEIARAAGMAEIEMIVRDD